MINMFIVKIIEDTIMQHLLLFNLFCQVLVKC